MGDDVRTVEEIVLNHTPDVTLLHLQENSHLLAQNRPGLNWIVSIAFFVLLILRRIADSFKKCDPSNQSGVLQNDLFYYLSTLSFENISEDEVQLALISIGLVIILVLLLTVANCAFSLHTRLFIIQPYVFLWNQIVPICFVLGINLFVRSYRVMEPSCSSYVVCFGFEVVLILLVSFQVIMNSGSVVVINHVFFYRDLTSCFICFAYYFITMHSFGIFSSQLAFDVFSVILHVAMMLFVVIYAPFYHVCMNMMLFGVGCFFSCASIARIASTELYWRVSYFVIVAGAVSALVYLLIVPSIAKIRKSFFYYFVSGRRKEAKEILEKVKIEEIPESMYRIVLVLANDLGVDRIEEFIVAFRSVDVKFFWLYCNLLYSRSGHINGVYNEYFQKVRRKLDTGHKKFWKAVWGSNLYKLPEISGSIGSLTERTRMQIEIMHEKYKNIEIEDDYGDVITHKRKYCVLEIIGIIGFIAFALCQVFLLIVLLSHSERFQAARNFQMFKQAFIVFHRDFIFGNSTESELNDLKAVFEPVSTNVVFQELLMRIPGHRFIETFESYMSAISSQQDFPYTEYREFVNSYDQVMSDISQSYDKSISEKTVSYLLYCKHIVLVFPLLNIVIIIIALVMNHTAAERFIEKFRCVDKEGLMVFGDLDTNQELFNTFPIKRSYSFLRSFPMSIIYMVLCIILCIVHVCFAIHSRNVVQSNGTSQVFCVYAFENLHRIPVYLISALMSSKLGKETEFFEYVSDSHYLCSVKLRDPGLHTFINQFPDSFYEIVGNSVMNSEPRIPTESTFDVIYSLSMISDTVKDDYSLSRAYIWQYFGCQMFCIILFTGVLFVISMRVKRLASSELGMMDCFCEKLDKMENSTSNTEDFSSTEVQADEEGTFDVADIPLELFIIDSSMSVIYQTKQAHSLLEIDISESITNSSLELSTVASIESQIKLYENNHSQKSVSIPLGNGHLLLTPFYVYKHRLSLDHIVIARINEPLNKDQEIAKRVSDCFYSVFPPILARTSKLPTKLSSNHKLTTIILLRLNGIGKWSETVSPSIVTAFRRAVSDSIKEVLEREDQFIRVRDTGNTLIFMVNRETGNKMSVWKMNETCAIFGEKLVKAAKCVCERFETKGIECLLLLFRTKDPDYCFLDSRMSVMDFEGAIIQEVEQCMRYCKPDIVNFTSLRKEAKMANTTRVRVCYKSSGEPYDMFIVV